MSIATVSATNRRRRAIAALMVLEVLTLATVSALHLTGAAGGGAPPYNPVAAGIAEAVIGVVLAAGAVTLVGSPTRGYNVARAAVGFAILGFLVGLTFTLTGGRPADVAYHLSMLPVLVLTLVLAATAKRPRTGRNGRR